MPRPTSSLPYYLSLFAATVLLAHAILKIAIVMAWPENAPVDVWVILGGIFTSQLVAIFSGVVTIVVSWMTSQQFGREAVDETIQELRQALSTGISSTMELRRASESVLRAAAEDPRRLLVGSLDPAADVLDEGGMKLLSERFRADLPTLLAVPLPKCLESPVVAVSPAERMFWKRLSEQVQDSPLLSNRKALLLPVSSVGTVTLACLETDTGRVATGLWSQIVSGPSSPEVMGVHASMPGTVALQILQRIARLIDEPASPYSESPITPDRLLEGVPTGIPVTRSILTTQLLRAVHDVDHVAATAQLGTRSLLAVRPHGAPRIQFEYSAEQFFPPTTSTGDHSGSVLADLLTEGKLDISNRNVWEVGCGPGYLTTIMAGLVGTGRVLACDISSRALELAKFNVARSLATAPVDYKACDCLDVSLSSAGERLAVTPPGGTQYEIDDVFIELPLLPYFGKRELTAPERAYLERAPTGTGPLPPTVAALLGRLAGVLPHVKARIVLPLCASSGHDESIVIAAVTAIFGASGAVQRVGEAAGFIRCISVSRT